MMRRTLLAGLFGSAAAGAAAQPAAPRELTAGEFWALYFDEAFVELQRGAQDCSGVARLPAAGATVRDKLREPQHEAVRITRQALHQFDDGADPRFDLTGTLAWSLPRATEAVIDGRYPYRSAPPFRPPRMAALVGEIGSELGGAQTLSVAALAQWLMRAVAAPAAQTDQRIVAAVWLLGERRDASVAPGLVEVLRRGTPWTTAATALSSTTTDTAFSALWKIADGSTLPALLALMDSANETGRWKCARLFERLLSTDHLLGSATLASSYARPATWAALIDGFGLSRPGAWQQVQARALRWELRCLAAWRCSATDAALLALLAADEVGAVRRVAQARRGRP